MSRIRFLPVFVLLVLLLSASAGAVMAQEPPPPQQGGNSQTIPYLGPEEPFLVLLEEGIPIREALQIIAPLGGQPLYVFFDFGRYTGFYRAPVEIDNLASVEAYEKKNHNAYLADFLFSLEKDIRTQRDASVRAAIQTEIAHVLSMRDQVETEYVPVTGFVLLAHASILEKAGSIDPIQDVRRVEGRIELDLLNATQTSQANPSEERPVSPMTDIPNDTWAPNQGSSHIRESITYAPDRYTIQTMCWNNEHNLSAYSDNGHGYEHELHLYNYSDDPGTFLSNEIHYSTSNLPVPYFDPAILDNPDEPQWTYGTGHGELLNPQTWYSFYIRTAPGTDPYDKARLRGAYVFNYAEWCDDYFWCQGEVSGEQALLIWPWYWIPSADKQWTY